MKNSKGADVDQRLSLSLFNGDMSFSSVFMLLVSVTISNVGGTKYHISEETTKLK